MTTLDDIRLRWSKRESVAAGPGSNRSRAKARKQAKKAGVRKQRRASARETVNS